MSTVPVSPRSGAIQPFMRLQSTNRCSQRPRKHADGSKLWMKNPQGVFEYRVKVVSAIYSTANHRWEYTLNDVNNEPIKGTTKETDLK